MFADFIPYLIAGIAAVGVISRVVIALAALAARMVVLATKIGAAVLIGAALLGGAKVKEMLRPGTESSQTSVIEDSARLGDALKELAD